jgi:hypothetical protein
MPFTRQNTIANTPLNRAEGLRLSEVLFYYFIDRMYEKFNAQGVYDFVDASCSLFQCDMTIIHQCMRLVMEHEWPFRPSKDEAIILMYRANIPVRSIAKLTYYSNTTIYGIIEQYQRDPIELVPRATNAQQSEMMHKFLQGFQVLKGLV